MSFAGVVQQAMRDAGVKYVKWVGCEQRQQELVIRWCDVAHNDNQRDSILLSAANKTELLLGQPPRADLYPLGDLYATDVERLGADFELSDDVRRLVSKAGGVQHLDEALRGLFEHRRDPAQAFAQVPQLRDDVLRRLDKNRLRLRTIALVPKIGARTLGIDLFI